MRHPVSLTILSIVIQTTFIRTAQVTLHRLIYYHIQIQRPISGLPMCRPLEVWAAMDYYMGLHSSRVI